MKLGYGDFIELVEEKISDIVNQYNINKNLIPLMKKMANAELSGIKDEQGVKIIDGIDNGRDGIYVFPESSAIIVFKDDIPKMIEVEDDTLANILAMSYVGRVIINDRNEKEKSFAIAEEIGRFFNI